MNNKDRIDLMLRAMDGDRTAWESLRSGESNFLVPATELDDAARAKVKAFFSGIEVNAVLGGVDAQWAEKHPEEMERLRKLGNRFNAREGNQYGEGKV
jgi:hypothetical protein